MATLHFNNQVTADSSETVSGKIRIATTSEANAGTNNTTAITPKLLQDRLNALNITGGVVYKGVIAASNIQTLINGSTGELYKISVGGSGAGFDWDIGDNVLINADMNGTFDANKINKLDSTDSDLAAVASSGSSTDLVDSNTIVRTANNLNDLANTTTARSNLGLGTSAVLDSGTSSGNVVVLDSTGLPAVDGSQLTNLPSAPITSVNSSTGAVVLSANDLAADHTAANYTAANNNIDGHLSGIDTKLGTLGGGGGATALTANTTLVPNTDYIIPSSVSSPLTLSVPLTESYIGGVSGYLSTQGETIRIRNLSDQTIVVKRQAGTGQNSFNPLKYWTGDTAPYVGGNAQEIEIEGRGEITLVQNSSNSASVEWWVHHSSAVEWDLDNIYTAGGLFYDASKKSFVVVGSSIPKVEITSTLAASDLNAYDYSVPTDHTAALIMNMPGYYNNSDLVTTLDDSTFIIENKGSDIVTLQRGEANQYTNSTYYRIYFVTEASSYGTSLVIYSGERYSVKVDYNFLTGNNHTTNYICTPVHADKVEQENVTTSTDYTVTSGAEGHKLLLVDNQSNNISVFLPDVNNAVNSSAKKPNYRVTVQRLGSGTLTVKGGQNNQETINGHTSGVSLSNQHDTATFLSRDGVGWWQISSSPISPPITSVNSSTGAVVLSADDLAADYSASNYTAANNNIDGHLDGIDTKLGTLASGLTYKGAFDANTPSPNLANALQGDLYIVSVAGTQYGKTWAVGDHLLINANMGGSITNSKIDKIDNTDSVTSVNNATGAVVLSADDLAADYSASNYTAANNNIDGHFDGIDTKFGTLGTAATSQSSDFISSTTGTLDQLSDVSFTAGSSIDNYVLTYNHAQTRWEAEQAAAGASTIDGLTDTDIVTPANSYTATYELLDHVLKYNSYTSKWESTQENSFWGKLEAGWTSSGVGAPLAGYGIETSSNTNRYLMKLEQITTSDRSRSNNFIGIQISTHNSGLNDQRVKVLTRGYVLIPTSEITIDTGGTDYSSEGYTSAGKILYVKPDTGSGNPTFTSKYEDAITATDDITTGNSNSDLPAGHVHKVGVYLGSTSQGGLNHYLLFVDCQTLRVDNLKYYDLSTLKNVDSTAPTDGQALTWDHNNAYWKPSTISGGIASVSADTSPVLGGNLDVSTYDIISSSNANIDLAPNGSGQVVIKGNATSGSGQIVLNCEQNSHGITIKGPPHSAAASYTLTLPDNDGNLDDVLQTDGNGNLSWTAQSSGGGGGGSAPVVSEENTSTTLSTPSTGVIEEIITVNSSTAQTITLALSANCGEGFKYQIKRLGSGAVTVDCGGSEFIDHSGQTSFSIGAQYDSITLVANNTSPTASWLLI